MEASFYAVRREEPSDGRCSDISSLRSSSRSQKSSRRKWLCHRQQMPTYFTGSERWSVKLVFIETPYGPAINWTSPFAIFFDAGRNLRAGAPQMRGLHPGPASEYRKGKFQYCSIAQAFPWTGAGSSQQGNEPPRRFPSGSGYAGLNTELSLQYQPRCSCHALIILFLFSCASSSARARSLTLNP